MAAERRVASEPSYAHDLLGIRRFIAKGDPLPEGWSWDTPDDVKAEKAVEPKRKPAKGKRAKS